ncbi:hypothetical protein NE237_013365 [Protea cynaroides]|uniref:DUF7725 domain-containing protein n=1 Tax=Protea cynaroides TaxID=273540 RepID=A0A9Q0JYX5_9MAGN|nr:hypothetical protein NE237_013365 [Protea cynaroides]
MEATAGVTAGRVGSLPVPSSQCARKEWRAVSENSAPNAGCEDVVVGQELERPKLAQSDESTSYEGAGPLDVNFCSITMDGGLDSDIFQQRLHSITRQREELQQMEIELKAQGIARTEIMEMQDNLDAQINEHANAAAILKEQLQEKDQTICHLEANMEEKERELRAIKIDNAAAWAKEDLLREQNKELVTIRRECENSEAERAQHLKQIHELKEHIEEKDRQLLELEEQNRVAQEAILYKDEQLREAQAWIARVQEMDALQSTNNHSLQAELRERTEQFNQIWLDCQRQFADIERMRLHTIQQLQLELAAARERSGIYNDESRMAHAAAKDASPFGQNRGSQFNVTESGTLNGNSGAPLNGNVDNVAPFVTSGNSSTKNDHVPGVPIASSSLLGMGTYLPAGQMTTLHPFIMHQQGVPQPVPSSKSHVFQSIVNHFQPLSAMPSPPHWQNQQAVSKGLEMPNQNKYQLSQTEQNLLRSDACYEFGLAGNGQFQNSDYLDTHISSNQEPGSGITLPNEEAQVHESSGKAYLMVQHPQNSQESSSQFYDASRLGSPEQMSETKDENIAEANHSRDGQCLTAEQSWSAAHSSPSDTSSYPVNSSETTENHMVVPETSISSGRTSYLLTPEKISEPTLLDEKSLLACIVRAIPAGSVGRIRISSTLPNRLGKMLAPLHWHDYKKKYGKLDDFVAGHPELFVIEGDFIQLREGAQEIISATAAVAKVAAAAAAISNPYSSLLPSVAVTPMAQTHRLKKVPSVDAKPVKVISTEAINTTPADVSDKLLQYSAMQNQHSNGVCFNIVQGLSNVKILNKPKDVQELNGFQSDLRTGHSSVHLTVRKGANPDKTFLASFPDRGSSNGRHGTSFGGKQQGRNQI